jgi:PAS domain S-box-containing protein
MTTTRKQAHAGYHAEAAPKQQERLHMAPSPSWTATGEDEHCVQFYESDEFLLNTVSSYIRAGLGAGAACIVIATKDHRQELEKLLRANGLDLSVTLRQEKYFALDAKEALAWFMVDGEPDPIRFTEVIGGLIARAAKNGRRVHVFGEMVALLWMEGNHEAAIRLEALWNELRSTTPSFSLFCAYPMQSFARAEYHELFSRIGELHSHVIPDEHYTLLANADERLRVVSALQQKAASLEAEIAERRAIEKQLWISENRYRRLFESSMDGILMVDPGSGIVTEANPALTRLLGHTREEVLGQELWQTGLFANRKASTAFLRELQKQRVLHYDAMPLRTRDGRSRYVEFASTLFPVNGHEIIQCTLRDVTERREESNAHLYLASIVSSSEDAILSKDLDGIITSWNAAAEHMFGYRAEEIVGQSVALIYPPARQGEFTQIMERIRRAERVEHYDTTRMHKDGSILPVSVMVSPIKNSSGTIIGASDIIRDMTRYKELEQQREAFISLVMHELKTPLTALQGNVQLAQRRLTRLLGQAEEMPQNQQQMLEEVLTMLSRSQQQLRVQKRLINDLLDISRIQEDKLELHESDINLVELVYETVQDYQAGYPSRLITLELPEQDPIMVYADRDRIQQVLANYMTNALKFSPASQPVHVGMSLEAGSVRVWVQDHGPGLSHEQQEHIWKRFSQASSTPVQSGWKEGLGLGLYICQQLIRRQHGQVGFESAPGNGATFWFTLPLPS